LLLGAYAHLAQLFNRLYPGGVRAEEWAVGKDVGGSLSIGLGQRAGGIFETEVDDVR